MLDFSGVRNKTMTMLELVQALTPADLHRLADEMIDRELSLLAGCTDADVVFVPADPTAYDSAAGTEAEVALAWTLGHVIVHTTASAEESAFLAAEMARGVPHHGRSRSEVPWQTVTTLAQCRARLEESRRMRHATLNAWPDEPHLDLSYQPRENGPVINTMARFVSGLSHEDSHLDQIADIVRQAKAARGEGLVV